MNEATDEDLIGLTLAGDPRAYEALMRRHNQRLYRAIRAVLRRDTDVEDVMQEAYVNAFTHLTDFRGGAKFSTWLTRIAVYEAFARIRKGKRFVEGEEEEMESLDPTPEDAASSRELGRVLEDAIESLPEVFRTVFVLRAVEEMSTAETAEVLDIPDDTVKTRLYRARALLQKSLLDRAGGTREVFEFHLSRCDRVVDGVMRRLGVRGQSQTD